MEAVHRAILTIDIGSTSRRAQLVGEDLISFGDRTWRVERHIDERHDGAALLDAYELLNDVTHLIDQSTRYAAELNISIAAVAMSCMWHSLLGLDEHLGPTTPVITWADTRAASHATGIRRRLDETPIHTRTGCPLEGLYFPAKIEWLRAEDELAWGSTRSLVSPADFVVQHFTGALSSSSSMASGTGLFDQVAGAWDEILLESLGIAASMMPPVDDGILGTVTTPHASRWPQLVEAPWFAALGDGAASTLGVDAERPGSLTVTIGTSAAARLAHESTHVAPPDRAWRYLLDRHRAITGGALSDGGNVIEWLHRVLKLPEPDVLEEHLASATRSSVQMTTTLRGERGPQWIGGGRGEIRGLAFDSTATDIAHAALSGVADRLVGIAEELAFVRPIETITITGGALAASPAWRQIVADAFDRPVLDATGLESSVRGAAKTAWHTLKTSSSAPARSTRLDLAAIAPSERSERA